MSSHGQGWGLEFYDCIVNNDLARLEVLVEQHKIDLNAKFSEIRKKNHLDLSPIHLVASKGYTGMLQYLYDMKCDVHLTTQTLRRTAFHFAVLRHKMACFHKLLQIGVNPDPRDTFGNSPCHYAAEDGACDILDVLLKQKIDVNAQDITLKTPLMKATRNGKLDAVRRLIRSDCKLNIRDKNRDTALHFAARHGSAGLVSVLIDAGSDVNIQNQWGHTPLMEATCYNNKDAALKLLNAFCDINLREYKSGDTALHVAVRKNYSVIIEQLLCTGKVKHVYNYHGELAIFDAVANQKMDTIRLFLIYNYDIDIPAKLEYDGTGGKTLVKISLEKGHYELLKLLATLGFVINFGVSLPGAQDAVGCGRMAAAAASCGGGGAADAEHACTVQRFIAEVQLVRSLKQLCRRVIRKHLGFKISDKVQGILLPVTLKGYILLKDIY